MSIGVLGKKVGMTQVFDADGRAVPVTVIEAGPCLVVEIRTPEKNRYSAVQLGFGEEKPGHVCANKRARAPELVFMAVITGTGEAAYRRGDGIYVIPIRALGA